MGNNPQAYCLPIELPYEDKIYKGGLCLSPLPFQDLYRARYTFLHPKELAYFESLIYSKRQYSYLLGRYCAKHAIAAYINFHPFREILIENGVFYYPVVTSSRESNLQVSISHTDTLGAALAFPEAHPMAIDVEKVCPSNIEIIKSQLSSAEKKLTFSGDEALQLTLLWTLKEALSKVLKCGLTVPFEILEVESAEEKENFVTSSFKNFKQYQALSFLVDTTVCSLVYPIKTRLILDISSIQRSLGNCSL